jgi:hypothetical protein
MEKSFMTHRALVEQYGKCNHTKMNMQQALVCRIP